MTNKELATTVVLAVGIAIITALGARADEAADHAALQDLVKKYEEAIQSADPSVLKPYLAPGFTGVMVTGEEVNSFESLQLYWNKIQGLLGEGGKYSVKINIPEPATIVGDVAFAHGTTEDTAVTSAGKEYKFQGFWTAVGIREGDGWKIVRIHGSMDAITNAFVAPMVRGAATMAGIVGGVIGFLLGAILLWMLGRRRRGPATVA